MSENENLSTDDNGSGSDPEVIMDSRSTQRFNPLLIAGLSLAGLLVVLLGYWWFRPFGGNAGRPVPPPRNVSLDTTPVQPLTNQTITLSPEQMQNAGVTVEAIGEQLTAESDSTAATGVVEANAYRQTPAVALAGGVIRRLLPELGANVRGGQTIAVIFSDSFAETQARYVALRTEVETARRNHERTQRLVAINSPGRIELEQATKQRRAAEAALNEMRNRYERTSRLLRIGAASREELEQDNTKLRTAEAEMEEAHLREQRASKLLPVGPEVRSANEEALNKLRNAEGDLAATRQKLVLFGMSESRVERLTSASQVRAELAVPAPISGTVTSRSVNPGEVIDANKELLRVTDLSSVWVIAQVYERDIARLRIGGPATIESDAFPARVFRGQIAYIDSQIDEATRTAKVRIELDNPGSALRLGMYVGVSLGALQTGERTTAVVPASAVQTIDDRQIVFVATTDPNTFELRPVRLGQETGGRFPVIDGITQGERVVTNGSFMLRAEWTKLQQGQPEHLH